jgi:alkylation response protein AidB-like acyl-CoA dehydrogenase
VTVDGAAGEVVGRLPDGALDALRDDVLVAWAADALGAARAVLGLAVEHAKVRHQFGQPIGAFQAVQHLLVDALETVELVAGGVLHAAWAADAAEAAERHLAALRLKAVAGRLAGVGDSAIQVLGGIGYTWEHDAHLYLRRLLGWVVAFGPASSYQVEVGRRAKMTRLSDSGER